MRRVTPAPKPHDANGRGGCRPAEARSPAGRRARLATFALLLAALALAGCYGQVQRTITIDSEPEGALCWLNDNEVGRTPVTVPFTWYGTYRVRLEKPGYEPLVTDATVRAPPFQWIPLDLAYETVVPGVHYDTHAFRYALVEATPTDTEGVRQRAESLRRDAGRPLTPPPTEPAPEQEGAPEPAPAETAEPAPAETAPPEPPQTKPRQFEPRT